MLIDEEIEFQKTKDAHVLELLRLCRSDMGQEHEIEHFFYAPDSSAAQAMIKEAQDAGYKASDCHYVREGQTVWLVMIFSPALPTDKAVNSESIFMLSLARKHNANYDGWGTGMVGDDVSMEDLDESENI